MTGVYHLNMHRCFLAASCLVPSVLALLVLVSACGGAVQGEGIAGSSGGAPGSSASASPTAPRPGASGGGTPSPPTSTPPSPPPSPPKPPPPPPDQCVPFDATLLEGSGPWQIGERILGDGWIRFLPSRSGEAFQGTAEYLPAKGQETGVFGCGNGQASYALDVMKRQMDLTFPPPCSAYRLDFGGASCTKPGQLPDVRVDVWFHDLASGIDFTEGVMAHDPTRCDATFSTCK